MTIISVHYQSNLQLITFKSTIANRFMSVPQDSEQRYDLCHLMCRKLRHIVSLVDWFITCEVRVRHLAMCPHFNGHLLGTGYLDLWPRDR